MSKLLGQVKSIYLERAELFGSPAKQIERDRMLVKKEFFDEQGRETEVILYNSAQSPIQIEGVIHAPGSIVSRYTKIYNGHGNLRETISFALDGSVKSKTIYSYDSNDKLESRFHYDTDGDITQKGYYVYDDTGNLSELLLYNTNGSIDARILFDLSNRADRPVRETAFSSDGLIQRESRSVYDADGNLIERSYYEEGGILNHKINYKYDSKGNLIEHSWYGPQLELEKHYVNTLDDNGILIKETINYPPKNSSEIYTFNYEFDAVGNWVKKVVTRTQSDGLSLSARSGFINYRTIIYW